MDSKITVCYCVNNTMAVPALISMYSALENIKKCELEIYIFYDNLSSKNIKKIGQIIGSKGSVKFRKANLSAFSEFDSLHGDRMTWLRTLLPELLPEKERILYIDADTLIKTDLSYFSDLDTRGFSIAAVPGGELKYALEKDLFIDKGLSPNSIVFNAGFLLFNTKLWKEKKEFKKIKRFALNNPCRSADQTALNYVFNERYFKLPSRFNKSFGPNSERIRANEAGCVVHFVGSPKPWDILGGVFHNNSHLFSKYVDRIGLEKDLITQKVSRKNIYRTAKIIRSYYKSI